MARWWPLLLSQVLRRIPLRILMRALLVPPRLKAIPAIDLFEGTFSDKSDESDESDRSDTALDGCCELAHPQGCHSASPWSRAKPEDQPGPWSRLALPTEPMTGGS